MGVAQGKKQVPGGTQTSLGAKFLPRTSQERCYSSKVDDQVAGGHTSSPACAFPIFPGVKSRSVGYKEANLSTSLAPTVAPCFSE